MWLIRRFSGPACKPLVQLVAEDPISKELVILPGTYVRRRRVRGMAAQVDTMRPVTCSHPHRFVMIRAGRTRDTPAIRDTELATSSLQKWQVVR